MAYTPVLASAAQGWAQMIIEAAQREKEKEDRMNSMIAVGAGLVLGAVTGGLAAPLGAAIAGASLGASVGSSVGGLVASGIADTSSGASYGMQLGAAVSSVAGTAGTMYDTTLRPASDAELAAAGYVPVGEKNWQYLSSEAVTGADGTVTYAKKLVTVNGRPSISQVKSMVDLRANAALAQQRMNAATDGSSTVGSTPVDLVELEIPTITSAPATPAPSSAPAAPRTSTPPVVQGAGKQLQALGAGVQVQPEVVTQILDARAAGIAFRTEKLQSLIAGMSLNKPVDDPNVEAYPFVFNQPPSK